MSLIGFLTLILIAAVAGAIGQAFAGYSVGGCALSAGIGFVGAFIGMWLADSFGLPAFFSIQIDGRAFPFVWAIVGSTILTILLGLLTRRRTTL
ncbi:MAG TPA: hypothetical protein VMN57_11625 [Anaerolineales bacterium]|nr:hypothetical protein [Anaerolineales bacterium]